MTNQELFDRYGREYHEYHDIHPKRRRQQLWMLGKFATAIGDKSILEATGDELQRYLGAELKAGLKPSTIGLHINYVRPFFSWAFSAGLVDEAKLKDIRGVKYPRGWNLADPKPYTKRERARFWDDFEETYPWSLRGEPRERAAMFFDRWLAGRSKWTRGAWSYSRRLQAEAIVALAIQGGLRRSEIYNLELENMDPDNEYLIVHSAGKGTLKGGVDRAVPWMTASLRQAIEDWLHLRSQLEAHFGGFDHERPWLRLFQREAAGPGAAMDEDTFNGTVARCRPSVWTFHRMRHTACTEMLRAGVSLQAASKIMGHRNLETTMRYVRLLDSDVVHAARLAERNFTGAMARRAA